MPEFAMRLCRQMKARIVSRQFSRHTYCLYSEVDARASAEFSIVIPVHNAPVVTERCLNSVARYAPEAEVVLVDDGSTSSAMFDILPRFRTRYGWRLIRHHRSVGHSEACRTGARIASKPYLCLLNSDTVVTPWCWRQLKEVFDCNPDIGVAGPSTSFAGNRQTLSLAQELRHHWSDSQIYSFAQYLLTNCEQPFVVDLPWLSGFALFIRRKLWNQLKGFDKKLPDYGNEVELCSRVVKAGYRTAWVRNSYIHHLGGQSYSQILGHAIILNRIRAAEEYLLGKKPSAVVQS